MRAFIAVDVSNLSIVKLQNDLLSIDEWNPRDIKPVDPRNLHFTLIFLGEINDQDVDRIKEMLARLSFEPFTITYRGIGAFPKLTRARVVWVGVDLDGAQKLTNLANDVITNMSELGFKADKPFSAHLTLLRAKVRPLDASFVSSKYQGQAFGSDQIDKVHLKRSELTPSGPKYSNVYTVEAKK
ncbi:MAG: RNA 2',3'-cyclic phosphodiesterase [Thermoproteota archaeon]|jgi:2'-5' RNA ligase|nr:RNA 2',3'-cyclic phosphodiesterase [Thermoproteota archaeon]